MLQSEAGGGDGGAGGAEKLTEEELAIHRIHREACEVRCITP